MVNEHVSHFLRVRIRSSFSWWFSAYKMRCVLTIKLCIYIEARSNVMTEKEDNLHVCFKKESAIRHCGVAVLPLVTSG